MRWVGRRSLVAVSLAATLAATTVVAGPAAAQSARAASPAASASPTVVPTPSMALPSRPADAELAGAASATLSDAPIAPPAEVDLAQVGAESSAQVEAMTTSQWSLTALVDSFEGDPERAFAFVRDSIGFEVYPGVLRGAEGTLAARAGNAWDRAILLRTLLDSMELTTRYATADLDVPDATRVAARVLAPVAAPLEDGSGVARRQVRVEAIGARASRDYALLRGVLGDRVATMRSMTVADLVPDARDHAWVQLRWGADWLDYDPTLPESAPGDRIAPATATFTDVPDDLLDRVTIRVVAGNLTDGTISQRTVLERALVASEADDQQVFLYFQPELTGIGGGIVRTLSGVANWTPVLMVDGEAQAGSAFEAGGHGTDIFGDPTDGPQLATLRVEVTRSVPGRPDETASHVLLDRVPTGRADSRDLAPEDLAPLAADDTGPLALGTIEQVLVSTGSANAWLQEVRRGVAADYLDFTLADESTADDHPLGDLLYPLAVANGSLVLGSERMSIPALEVPGRLRGYVAAPRVYLVAMGQDPDTADDLGFGTDLLIDDVRVVAVDDGSAQEAAMATVWYGALESALETEDALARAGGLGSVAGGLVGTSLMMSRPLTVLSAGSTGRPALRAALADGALVVVPGDPATSRAWWTIDPVTGATHAVLDPGAGGVNGKVAWGAIKHRPPVIHRGGAGGANTHWLHPDGSIRRYPPGRGPGGGVPQGPPPSRCGGGTEYVTILGCVSIPAAWAIRIGVGLIVTAVVTDAIIVFLIGT